MSWTVRIGRRVARKLTRIPQPDRERIIDAFAIMERDPLSGDVARLKGYPKSWRRRVGDYWILFDLDREERAVDVTEVARRTSTTCRGRT